MCPLRLILIFLSATLAGFFVLRSVRSSSDSDSDSDDANQKLASDEPEFPNVLPLSSRVCTALGNGFWTCVDMASGKYLWRNLVSSSGSLKEKLSAD